MERFALVIFDCDGVLVDSEMLSCQCLVEVFQRYGVAMDLEGVFGRFLGRSSTEIGVYYTAVTGAPLPDSFRTDYRAELEARFRASLRPMPHVFDVLGGIAAPFCLASSSDLDRIRLTLSVTGLDAWFGDRVFSAGMVRRGKPAPDLFLHAARQMSASPGEALVIEDSLTGVTAGKAAGMTVWGFTGGSHNQGRDMGRQLAAAGAERVFGSLAELRAA